ncbi:hypothetical protein [Gracilibacillus dipsosauri]|uniref:Resolvase HTH domain-containing protein n=2 Tax=Gracilibacillus TaxID=74385 RepID=A0A317KZS7_9BACI|nr:hypothetical protein [Gracilibacillus dipsosauri]PWU68514.1 hypothetical protein DLJ74_08740 [Gracilibacillus dipsosauri]
MLYVLISLIIIGVILWILSFFMHDRFKQIEDQLEQFSISSLQETYQLKKKISILEEELLMDDDILEHSMDSNESTMNNKIANLYVNGYDIPSISRELNISEFDVRSVINQL